MFLLASFRDEKLHFRSNLQNSLYPATSIAHEFPVGKPERILGKKLESLVLDNEKGFLYGNKRVMGMVQATVLAPDSLFLPILPVMSHEKLIFGLCKTCMDLKKVEVCTHSDAKRAITSVWTSAELEFACLENGYRVLAIHEFFGYTESFPVFRRFYTK